jgi:hypothetical protein
MAYEPITGTFIQYQKSNGGFASNYYLKFYKSGLNDAIQVAPNRTATDDNGNTLLLDKVRLNTYGSPVNPSGGDIIPHVDQAYKIALYKNAADADANNLSNADRVIDNVSIGNIGAVADVLAYAAEDISYKASATATTTDVKAKLQEAVSVLDFGADNTGATSSTTPFANALLSGLNVYVPVGTYLGKFVVKSDFQSIHFQGGVVLKAESNNDVMFKQDASYSNHTGGFIVDSNSKTNISGIQCGPENLAEVSTKRDQIHNRMPMIIGDSNMENVVVIQCGPEVGSVDSQNQWNIWPQIIGGGAKCVVYLKSTHSSNTNAKTPRYHVFHYIKSNGLNTNTVVDIEAGLENDFHRIDGYNVASGTSPNTTPTAIKIDASCGVTGEANNYNKFFSGSLSGNSRDVDNSNATTNIISLTYSHSNSSFTNDPEYTTKVRKKTITTSNFIHTTDIAVSSITNADVRYLRLGDSVNYSGYVEFVLQPGTSYSAASTTDIKIDLPFNADSDYTNIKGVSLYMVGAATPPGALKPIPHYFTTTDLCFDISETELGYWYTLNTNRVNIELHFDVTYYTR